MSTVRIILLVAPVLAWPGLSYSADPAAGEAKAAECMICHSPAQLATGTRAEILARIQAVYAPGSPHPRGVLSDEDLADIAAFFAQGQ